MKYFENGLCEMCIVISNDLVSRSIFFANVCVFVCVRMCEMYEGCEFCDEFTIVFSRKG